MSKRRVQEIQDAEVSEEEAESAIHTVPVNNVLGEVTRDPELATLAKQFQRTHEYKRRRLDKADREKRNNKNAYSHNLEWTISPFDLDPKPFPTRQFDVVLTLHRSGDVCVEDMDRCYNLVAFTSRFHYKKSTVGWSGQTKRAEMEDESMWYILVRRAESTEDPVAKATNTSSTIHAPQIEKPSKKRTKGASRTRHTLESPTSPVLGFLSFMFAKDDPPNEKQDVLYIYEIHLRPLLRGAGLGSHLLKAAERIAKRHCLTKIMLTVFVENQGATKLYTRQGYVKDACSPGPRERTRGLTIPADYMIMSKEWSLLVEGTENPGSEYDDDGLDY